VEDTKRRLGNKELVYETTEILSTRRHRNIRCSSSIILLDSKREKIILGERTDLPPGVYESIVKSGRELKWTLAGGGVEEDESPIRGAMRELKEEFNIEAGKQTRCVEPISYRDNYFLKHGEIVRRRDFTFITSLKPGVTVRDIKPQQGEIGNVRAFTKEEIINMAYQRKIYLSSENALLMAIKDRYI
jgi:8-oxo-dGTP pyrophosphatase MutT (NUDIX family)